MTELPKTCVLDASVGIKLFVPEKYSEDVQRLMEESLLDSANSLFVPDLFFIECANILWKKVQRGEYAADVAADQLVGLRALELQSTPTADLMERALEIACLYGITAYDACYVALSERNQSPLLTADARLAEILSDSPFNVITLGD